MRKPINPVHHKNSVTFVGFLRNKEHPESFLVTFLIQLPTTPSHSKQQLDRQRMRSACLFFAFALLVGSAYAFIVVPTQPQVSSGLAYSSGAAVPLPEPSFPTDVLGPTPIRRAPRQTALKMPGRPEHIQEVITMEEYNAVVAAEKDQVVVVRFYAPWCRVSSLPF
jgi:hypothetical protein